MNAIVASYARLTALLEGAWYAIPLRFMVGYGFMEHGYAKLARGPDSFAIILHAMGIPEPSLLAALTILVELIGGFAVLIGAFIPLASIPMAAVLLVAIFTVHLPYGFSSIKLESVIWQRSVPWCWEDRDHWPSIGFLFGITIALLPSHRAVHWNSKTSLLIDRIFANRKKMEGC